MVRWNGVTSYMFSVKCGVRQGGVLSPWLFNIYVNDLIIELETNCEGCYVSGKFLGCIMYTDDLLLLSASVSGLQSMLNICYCYGIDIDIIFNRKKSVCFKVGLLVIGSNLWPMCHWEIQNLSGLTV